MRRVPLLPVLLVAVLASGLAPAAAALDDADAREARGTVRVEVGHLVEARPAGPLGWTTGRSNVQAVWTFEPLDPRADVLLASGAGPLAPAEARTAEDLTAETAAHGWRSHPGCDAVAYRGRLDVPTPAYYEVCDGGTEAYVAPTRDLAHADRALLPTHPVPGREATREAFEIRLRGNPYVFTGAPHAAGVAFRQGRLVPLADAPVLLDVRASGPLLVRLHDVVLPAHR